PGAHNASAIAHHYAAGGDQPRALVAMIRAGEAAESVHANGEAAALFERALELWERVPDAEALTGTDRVELLRSAAWNHQTTGEASAPMAEIRALDALGVSLAWLGDPEGVPLLRRSIALALEHGMPITALTIYANLSDVYLWRGHGRDALAAVDEGLALAD